MARYQLRVHRLLLLHRPDECHEGQRGGKRAADARRKPSWNAVCIGCFRLKFRKRRNSPMKQVRSLMAHSLVRKQVADGLQSLQLLTTIVATRDMRFDSDRIRSIELTIDEPSNQQAAIFTRRHLARAP